MGTNKQTGPELWLSIKETLPFPHLPSPLPLPVAQGEAGAPLSSALRHSRHRGCEVQASSPGTQAGSSWLCEQQHRAWQRSCRHPQLGQCPPSCMWGAWSRSVLPLEPTPLQRAEAGAHQHLFVPCSERRPT